MGTVADGSQNGHGPIAELESNGGTADDISSL